MQCVKCDGQLRPVTVGEVEVDRCDKCSVCYGQWLDGGELEALSGESFISKIRSLFR